MKNLSILIIFFTGVFFLLFSCSNKEPLKKNEVKPKVIHDTHSTYIPQSKDEKMPIEKTQPDNKSITQTSKNEPITNPSKKEPISQSIERHETEEKPASPPRTVQAPLNDIQIKELKSLSIPDGSIEGIIFSKDGTLLAACGRYNDINIWEVKNWRLLKTLKGHTNTIESIDFSNDGHLLTSGSWDGTVRIWNIESGELLKILRGHTDKVRSVSFSPDDQTIASGSDDKSINLWNAETGRLIRTIRANSRRIKAVKFSPKGGIIASGGDEQQIKIWDSNNGRLLKTFSQHTSVISSIAFSPDGGTIASGSWDSSIILWNVENGNMLKTLKGHSISVRAVVISPDGTLIASGSDDQTIKFWNEDNGELLKTQQTNMGNIFTIAFSPDGTKLASGDANGSLKIWEVPFALYARAVKGSQEENGQTAQAEKSLPKSINADTPPISPSKANPSVLPPISNNTNIQGIPELSLDLILSDEDQNGVFEGRESMYIIAAAKNTGTAASYGTKLNVEGIEPFHIPAKLYIGDIPPGRTVEKRFAYELPEKIKGTTGNYNPKFTLEDNKGFKSAPKVFNINASDFEPPELELDYAVKSSGKDGKLNAGQEAILYLYLRNISKRGKAKNIKVTIGFPHGVYMIGKNTGLFSINTLNNGEFKELTTPIVISQDYAQKANNVPVSIKIISKETSLNKVINLSLNEYLPSPEEIDVKSIYTKQGREPETMSSDIDKNILSLPDPKPADKDTIALVIGIDTYKNIPRSLYSLYDAILMYNLIKKSIKAEDIYMITDQDASYLTIKDKINYIAQNGKDKTIFIYYSGHGFSTEDRRPSIVPYDTPQSMPDESLITLDSIINILYKEHPKKVIIITDSCYSGTDREGRSLIAAARPIFNVPERVKLPENFVLMAATDNKGKSYSDKLLKHGIFTYYTALALTGAATKDEGTEITAGEVYNYVREMVVIKTKKLGFYDQIPSINPEGEDIVIIKDIHK